MFMISLTEPAIKNRHPEVLGATHRASKDDGTYWAASFEARSLRSLAPQRLCSFSSGLPLFFVPEHGVEHDDNFPGHPNQSDHFRLTASDQALIEDTQHWIAPNRAHRGHEDRGTCSWSATSNHAFSLPLPGLAREGGVSDQARNLAASEAAELRHIRQHGARDAAPDTRKGDHQVFFFAPDRRATHHGIDIAVDDRQLLLEACDVASNALAV